MRQGPWFANNERIPGVLAVGSLLLYFKCAVRGLQAVKDGLEFF